LLRQRGVRAAPGRASRILIADDDPLSRADLARALSGGGFAVVGEATSGKGAARLAEAIRPDALLLAVGLPDLDGIEVARRLLRRAPLPIVLLSSRFDPQTIERAKSAGVMACLAKPLRAEELRPALELAISRFRELAALREENESLKSVLETRKAIERAKGVLMEKYALSEAKAFSLIRKKSMDLRKSMAEVARAILVAEELTEERAAGEPAQDLSRSVRKK
jgi:AmiR/NasT family two-component response regulator